MHLKVSAESPTSRIACCTETKRSKRDSLHKRELDLARPDVSANPPSWLRSSSGSLPCFERTGLLAGEAGPHVDADSEPRAGSRC